MGIDQPDSLESIFGRYGRVTLGISLLLQGESFFDSPTISQGVAEIYADLLQLSCHVTMEYNDASRTQDMDTMNDNINEAFFLYFNLFNSHWRRITQAILTKVQNSQFQHRATLDIPAIYQFLELQDRPLQMILEGHDHSLADGSFEWFGSHLTNFSVGNHDVMAVTGNPGCGKSALAQWTAERLQVSAEYDIWNVVTYSIREFTSVLTSVLICLCELTDWSSRGRCTHHRAVFEYPQRPYTSDA